MKSTRKVTRRRFLALAGAGAGGAVISACSGKVSAEGLASAPALQATPTPGMPGMQSIPSMPSMPAPSVGRAASPDFQPDVEINIRAVVAEQAIFTGPKTRVWRYLGEVVKGDPAVLMEVPNAYLGPVLRLRPGQKVRINFTNELPEPSIIHWHGLRVPSEMDGLPEQAVGTGGTYVYEFTVQNRAGTSWFHPHPDMRTGFQAYHGLAGLILVSDAQEEALGLPSGDLDMPLVIQDRLVDAQNQLIYPANMMAMMNGALGDRILVNGIPNAVMRVSGTAYRLRLLNGSNARTYKLAWEDGTPWTVIGTDGGLLEKPLQRPYLTLSPGERVEVVADFSKYATGQQVRLVSRAFSGAGMMMGGGMMGARGGMMSLLPNGAEFSVMTVKIARAGAAPRPLPQALVPFNPPKEKDALNAANPRTFVLSMAHMNWLMNGRTYEPGVVAPDEVVKLNTTEVWVFTNGGGTGMGMGGRGGMMNMPHVMHLHTHEFKIIERSVEAGFQAAWETVKDGFVDEGWKDTFFIMPGESVKFLVRFTDFSGLYMYHCHIIEHEDMGMMRYYRVDA